VRSSGVVTDSSSMFGGIVALVLVLGPDWGPR